jgi:alkylglycerol monooxygenase
VAARFPKPAFDISHPRYDPPLSRGLTAYLMVQFVLLLGMSMHFLALVPTGSLSLLLGYAAYLVASLCVLGVLMEGRASALWLEAVRVLATALVPLVSERWFGIDHLDGHLAMVLAGLFGLSALALPWLHRGQRAVSVHPDATPV